MEQIIECNNLTHYYGKRLIYENLSFTVSKGRTLRLLGENGMGETTTINILSGYLKPRSEEYRIFGQEIQTMAPASRRNIGLLIEGHVQYQFMSITQIEKFYTAFCPNQWKRKAYCELMSKLKVAIEQRVSRTSCGQRSQVAFGLILAQNPELFVSDDFSLGLDPGYRCLFVDYLHDYTRSEGKTVLPTSHIIRDMGQPVDDCIMMNYRKILIQKPTDELLKEGRRYTYTISEGYELPASDDFYHPPVMRNILETLSFLPPTEVEAKLRSMSAPYMDLYNEHMNLEGAFIGPTGKH